MSFFSRNKDPVEPALADDVPFESLRRTPRGSSYASRRAAIDANSDDDSGAPLDPAQAAKTRGRRRLIGAIALALAAVVFVPMMFDRAQTPPADDITVQIPDRDTPFEGRRSVPRDSSDASKTPLRPSSPLPIVTPSATPPAAPGAANDLAAPSAAALDASKAAPPATHDAPVEKPVSKAAEKNDKPAEKSSITSQGDDPLLTAALEGKLQPRLSTEAASGKGFAVQIAAFSVADKAKTMRDQLSANGLKAYTEPLSTSQGLRTRVRLGPFASREAAERARQKLKTMKLDGAIVPL